MNSSFGDDVGVKTVAEVNGVDVVTAASNQISLCVVADFRGRNDGNSPFQIAVHDSKEDLQEQVDGVDEHRQQVEPRFTGHVADWTLSERG